MLFNVVLIELKFHLLHIFDVLVVTFVFVLIKLNFNDFDNKEFFLYNKICNY